MAMAVARTWQLGRQEHGDCRGEGLATLEVRNGDGSNEMMTAMKRWWQ